MKKLLSIAVAAIMLIGLTAAPALAAHGPCNGGRQTTGYSVCAIESCIRTGRHDHNGKTYSAHYYGDGHDYHEYCGVNNCTSTGYHEHNGVYCFGQAPSGGRGSHCAGRGRG